MRTFFIPLILLFGALSCTAQHNQSKALNLDEHHAVILLDSTAAAAAILRDQIDHFFEYVTASEMSIQMKSALQDDQTRESMLPDFKMFLQRDVANFTEKEREMATEVMQEIFKTCQGISSTIFPDSLILLKINGLPYGKSVYYTRENMIVIPEDALQPGMRNAFKSTMYHELFHVYSRLNPDKRKQLYKLIGFEPIGLKNLELPEALAARLLFNPDGVDFAQRISLATKDGSTIDAIPVIYSKSVGFKTGVRAFFGYVEFNLYQIEQTDSGTWKVITKEDGFTSTLNLRELPDFFSQIKDNTGYIIHPDEVLADNFSFLMREKEKPGSNDKFSEEGKQLITKIESVLAN